MVRSILDNAQRALDDYRIYQLRLAIAISCSQYQSPGYHPLKTIGETVNLFNLQTGIAVDQLPLQDPHAIKTAISHLQGLEGFAQRYPLVMFHLSCLHGNPSNCYTKKAILAHPDCQYLYLTYFSPHRSILGIDPFIRKRYTALFNKTTLWNTSDTLYFSPLLQISIGHWFHLLNTIRISLSLSGAIPPITVFLSDIDSGRSLIDFINNTGFAVVHTQPIDSVLAYTLKDSVALYNSDYYTASLSASVQDLLQYPSYTSRKMHITSKTVFFHLRTSLYKNDGHSHHANLRNVTPSTYSSAIRYLRDVKAYDPVLLTADPDADYSLPLKVHQVYDCDSELEQWTTVSQACFSVGTASGLSHLFNLGAGHTFRTNSNGLALDDFFTDKHLIACKRFKLCDSADHIPLDVYEFAYLVCLPWEIENGFASIAIITDLDESEILFGIQEYLDIFHGTKNTNTLHNILSRHGLSKLIPCVPNRNLARSTVNDFELALKAYKQRQTASYSPFHFPHGQHTT